MSLPPEVEFILGIILPLLPILQFGIWIGSYIAKKEAKETYNEIVQDHRKQKREMWLQFKKTKGGF